MKFKFYIQIAINIDLLNVLYKKPKKDFNITGDINHSIVFLEMLDWC